MLFRRLMTKAHAGLQPSLDPLAPLDLYFRVWPTDLNFGGHMDNVRYMSLMDLGRSVWFTRTGVARLRISRRLSTPVAAAQVRYRRELRLRHRFTLRTRLVFWDSKWFFLEQSVDRGDSVANYALFKCAFVGSKGTLDPQPLLQMLAPGPLECPAIPPAVQAWFAAETAARQRQAV